MRTTLLPYPDRGSLGWSWGNSISGSRRRVNRMWPRTAGATSRGLFCARSPRRIAIEPRVGYTIWVWERSSNSALTIVCFLCGRAVNLSRCVPVASSSSSLFPTTTKQKHFETEFIVWYCESILSEPIFQDFDQLANNMKWILNILMRVGWLLSVDLNCSLARCR